MSGQSELVDEVKLLVETVLERLEPSLRRTAAGEGKPDWDGCGACPICAVTAILRGEQHELVTSLAEHGTAIVTILREALAGAPVEPLGPGGAASPTEPGAGQAAADSGAQPAPVETPPEENRFVSIPVTIKP